MINLSTPLPKGWRYSKLGELSAVIRGITFPKEERSKAVLEGYLACLRTTNIQKKVEWDDIVYIPKKYLRNERQNVKQKDILISTANSLQLVGKVAQIEDIPYPATIGAFISIIRSYIDPTFTYFQLSSSLIQSSFRDRASTTTNISNISTSDIIDMDLCIPPLPEQRRIVGKIEELFTRLDAGVEALNKIKFQLKRYRQAILKTAFEGKLTAKWREAHKNELESASALLEKIKTERVKSRRQKESTPLNLNTKDLPGLPKGWVWARVIDVTSKIQYGTSDKASEDNSGIPVVRMGNIQDGKLVFDNLKYLPKHYPLSNDYALNDGDVLFNRTNSAELVGKTAVYRTYHPKAIFASYLIRVVMKKAIYVPEFLSYFINSYLGREYINNVVSQQVGQANVNGTKLSLMLVPLLPLGEQQKIIEEIECCFSIADEIETIVDQSLKQSQRLRQSILKKAFEGKLVPQDPNDEPVEKLLEKIKAEKGKQ